MSLINNSNQYGSISKIFHWTTFLLVAFMLLLGFFMGDIGNKILRAEVVNLHKLIGLFILLFIFLRASWASVNIKPVLPLNTPLWEKFAERVVHYLLYTLLFLMPLSGWVGSSLSGKPPVWGHFHLGLPLYPNKLLIKTAFDLHYKIAIILIALVCIHVAAALYHHFVKRDNVLLRMLTTTDRESHR